MSDEKGLLCGIFPFQLQPRIMEVDKDSVVFWLGCNFSHHNTLSGCSNDAFEDYCKQMKLPFRCLLNKLTAQNNRHFGRFALLDAFADCDSGRKSKDSCCMQNFFEMALPVESVYTPSVCDGIMPTETATLLFTGSLITVQLPAVKHYQKRYASH